MRSSAVMKTACGARRDDSPDSVVFTLDSTFSAFSSASVSIGRCSHASDSHSLASSDSSLAPGRRADGGGNVGGGDNNLDNFIRVSGQRRRFSRRHGNASHVLSDLLSSSDAVDSPVDDKDNLVVSAPTSSTPGATVSNSTGGSSPVEEDDDLHNSMLDSSRTSPSLAIKECRGSRSSDEENTALNHGETRSPLLHELEDESSETADYSVGGSSVSNCSASRRSSGNIPRVGTSAYLHRVSVINNNWGSERVSLSSASAGNTAKFQHPRGSLYFSPSCNNVTGKTLPSKWEDAERWIFSPGSHPKAPLQQGVRKPTAKSGPVGKHFSQSSIDTLPDKAHENVKARLVGCSTSITSGLVGTYRGTELHRIRYQPFMARSVSIHGCPEGMARHSIHTFRDAKVNDFTGVVIGMSRSFSRRDIATQMSPNGSFHSSPGGRFSFSKSIPAVQPDIDLQWHCLDTTKVDVRGVQVEEAFLDTRWSNGPFFPNHRKSSNINNAQKNPHDSPGFDLSAAENIVSKCKREEAKINAWESLQKAKAETAIRKLEMKLEKRRFSSMEKIMSKLRSAQQKARDMRSAGLSHQKNDVSEHSKKAISFRRSHSIGSLTGCFACHAF